MRLHYGLFKLRVSQATYLVARRDGRLAGAIGITLDHNEKIARIFELISPDDQSVRFLLERVVERCDGDWGMVYVEVDVDVNAHEPRMQRTLLELGFRACAYVPAMVFDRVERLDAIRMVRLGMPLDISEVTLIDSVKPLAAAAIAGFQAGYARPEILDVATRAQLFAGMSSEQVERMADAMDLIELEAGDEIVTEGSRDQTAYLLLEGEADVFVEGEHVGRVSAGECLGELALLTGRAHRATARAGRRLRAAVLEHAALTTLVRARPDLGVVLYRNLALDLREKLDRVDRHPGGDPDRESNQDASAERTAPGP